MSTHAISSMRARNPPYGVIIYYNLPETVDGPVSLTLLDDENNEIRTYTTKPEPPKPTPSNSANGAEKPKENPNARYITAKPGMNRFVWDMRYPDCVNSDGDITMQNAVTGPVAAPGNYQVQLKIGNETLTECFQLRIDPNTGTTQEEMDAQFKLWNQINSKLSETHETANRIRRMREQVEETAKRMKQVTEEGEESAILKAADTLKDKLETLEGELVNTKAKGPRDRLRIPAKLNTRLNNLLSVVGSADAAPTKQTYDVFGEVSAQVDEQIALFDGLLGDDIPAFNDLVAQSAVPAVVV